jgi:hypothetical protein
VSKLSERQRLILTITVTVLVIGGLVALILGDRSEIESIQGEIASLDTRIQAADVEIRRTKDREDKVIVFRAVEERELAVLPTRQKIADFHRNLSTFLLSAGLRFQELPESMAVESELAKGIYVTRTGLTCQGDSPSLLNFLNMLENDPRLVAIKGLKVKAGMKDRTDPLAPVLHDVECHIETYYYSPKGTDTQQVHIPNEEARLQEPAIKEAIAAFQPERPDTYVLRPSASRRDPLVDPRQARPKIDEAVYQEQYARESKIVDDLDAVLQEINEKVETEKALVANGELFKADRLGKEIDLLLNELQARLAQVEQMKTVVIPELVAKVQDIRIRVDELGARRPQRSLTVTRGVAERTEAEVREAFDAGAYADVASMTSAWLAFLRDKQIDADAVAVVESISRLRTKAKTLSDFQAISVKVTGTIVDPVDPLRSVAMVNGRALHTGDKLDKEGEVVVGRVERHAVEFVFRGESIVVTRQGARPARGAPPAAVLATEKTD